MRILVIPGFAEETGSANIACLNEVVNALRSIPDIEITTTGETLKSLRNAINWKKAPVFALRKIINWPVIDPNASDECFQEIEQELNRETYDAMIVCHMPYDGVLAALKAKLRHPEILFLLYELDPITYEIDRERNSLGKYLYFLRERAERHVYDNCDAIFHMECNRTKYQHSSYEIYKEKSWYIDFPLIHHLGVEGASRKPLNRKVKLIYTGKLMEHFRSPEYLLKVIVLAQEMIDLDIVFYSNGNCENMLQEYASKHSFIRANGFIDKDKLQKEIESADFLVNIGNKMSDMLPSKLLTYIETGKPIIHINNQLHDACLPYLNRYESAIIISEEDPVKQSAERLASFLRNYYGKRVSSDYITNEFNHNTPEYSAKVIVDIINAHIQK